MALPIVGVKVLAWMKSLGGKIAGLIGLIMTAFALGVRWYSNRQRVANLKAKVKEIRRLMAIEEAHNAKSDQEIADEFADRYSSGGD